MICSVFIQLEQRRNRVAYYFLLPLFFSLYYLYITVLKVLQSVLLVAVLGEQILAEKVSVKME